MRCAACGHESPEDDIFCGACGARLVRVCSACGRSNPPDHGFCGGCGAPLASPEARPPPSVPQASAPASEPAAERRQLTVLFCDLVGSTALSEQLDPEELRAVVHAYQEAATARVVEQYDGHVAQYLGDGLLVYFGYPHAHEDDAVRGVNAALALLEELPELSERMRERLPSLGELQVRIGVHTGPVVVGEMGSGERREQLALGETVNVASRLLSACEPGEIVISEATRNLAVGAFILEDRRARTFKGISDPLRVYRVVGRTGLESRLDRAALAGLTPLVGREQETGLLLDRWESVSEGRGQAVLVSGEAGMGKSRLLLTLRERLADEPHLWLESRASAYHQDSALYPTLRLLEQALDFQPDETPARRVAKLEAALETVARQLSDALPLFADLLSLPLPEGVEAPPLGPEEKRRRTFEAIAAWLLAASESLPVVLVVEDLHWLDPSTLELLGLLLDQVPTARMLLLFTFRPDFAPPWSARTHRLDLALHPLTRKQIEAMVTSLAGGKALPAAVVDQLAIRTDGVPLFVEELTRSVLESGLLRESDHSYERTDPLPELAIPATLQDSLMARLDRLGPAKELVQCAAVLGREFPHELLEAISSLRGPDLEQALTALREEELLYQRGAPPHAVYSFKHTLIQEVAYDSLLKSRRRQLHGAIADALAERFPERVEAEPELLARHCERADRIEEAIAHHQRAGEHATGRYANAEASRHLSRAIELLRTLPESPERDEQELLLQVMLGAPHGLAWGFAAAERNFRRARELCEKVGDAPRILSVLVGLFTVYVGRLELRSASEQVEQLLLLAERSGRPEDFVNAHGVCAIAFLFRGEAARCLEQAERALAFQPGWGGSEISVTGTGVFTTPRIFSSLALWMLGRPERAVSQGVGAIARVRELLTREHSSPATLALALLLIARLRLMCREPESARALLEECVDLATRQDLPFFVGVASFLLGRIRAAAEPGAAIEQMQREMSGPAAIAVRGDPYNRGLLAEVLHAVGRSEEGLQSLAAALAASEAHGACYWDAEMLRLKGEILLDGNGAEPEEAEALFQRSLEIARSQEARSLELRTATSLARLWQKQGQKDEARAVLAPVYGWFTEGFDTPDLLDAKALLDALS